MLKGRELNHKGQVTVFVILGIVLILAFSFAFMVRSSLSTGKLEAEAQEILTDALETSSIDYYVESCLEQITTEALVTLGEQGGKLHMRNGDPGEDFFILNESGVTTPINYGIKPNTKCPEVISTPPSYPRSKLSLENFQSVYETSTCKALKETSGFLGEMGFDLLCYRYGPNSRAESGGLWGIACPKEFLTSSENNTQTLLENYVSLTLPACANLSFYEDYFGHNITFPKDGRFASTLIYGFDGLTIEAQYPFIVKVGKKQVKTFHNFSYESKIPYREIYQYVADLAAEETGNHSFNISRDYQTLGSYHWSYNVTFIEDPCKQVWSGDCLPGTEHDDLVLVEDKNTYVKGKPYKFIFAIKNRIPVLDYIHTTDPLYDIKIIENETLTIKPIGIDPDDKEVTYTYKGWKEEYNETMDLACCEQANRDYALGIGVPCYLADCVYRQDVEIKNWTRSNLYEITGKDAEVNLTRGDMGVHHFQVYTYDDTGLFDYQNVSVLVFDLPKAVPETNNGFDGVPNNIASMEDPYLLNGSASEASMVMGGSSVALFDWIIYENISLGNYVPLWRPVENGIAEAEIYLPYQEEYAFYSADGTPPDMKQVMFDRTGEHVVELSVSSSTAIQEYFSEPEHVDVEVYECIPYMDGHDYDYMYPYNNTGVTTFDYNHICCDFGGGLGTPAWGKVVGEANCYDETFYGLLKNLLPVGDYQGGQLHIFNDPTNQNNEVRTNQIFYYGITGPEYVLNLDFDDPEYNDIYSVQVIRSCGGTRGNVCEGPIHLYYAPLRVCPDFIEGPNERCYGFRDTITTNEPSSCWNYGTSLRENPYENTLYYHQNPQWRSFESQQDVSNSDGLCDTTTHCFPTSGRPQYSGDYSTEPYTPLLCEGGCATGSTGIHGCELPVNCVCSKLECGADCEAENDWTWNADGYQMCRNDCNTETCTYGTEVYCPNTLCLINGNALPFITNRIPFEDNCENTITNLPPDDYYAYYGGGQTFCEEQACDWTSADILARTQLNKQFCYACNNNGCSQNQRCNTGEYNDRCYYLSNAPAPAYCNYANGACVGMTSQVRPYCPVGQSTTCTSTGWSTCA